MATFLLAVLVLGAGRARRVLAGGVSSDARRPAPGINIVPRGLWFLSAAHTDADVDRTLEIVDGILARW